VLQQHEACAEVEVGEKERQRERQRKGQPAPDEFGVQAEPDAAQPENLDHDKRIDDREGEGRGVGPHVESDAGVRARPEHDEPCLNHGLAHDRDRVELRATD
jgi:hypothetical protein